MQLKQLEYVLAVDECGSFSKAANRFYTSPQALSRSIASLEKELGIEIFERFHAGVVSTQVGKHIVTMSKKILAEYEQTMDVIQVELKNQKHIKERIKLYSHTVMSDAYVDDIVVRFNTQQSDIQVDLSEYNVDVANKILAEEENCLVFAIEPEDKYRRSQATQCLENFYEIPDIQSKYIACVSEDCILAKQNEVSLKILSQFPIVRFKISDTPDDDAISNYFKGYHLVNVHSASTLFAWVKSIEQNMGIGIVADFACRRTAKTRKLFDNVKILKINDNIKLLVGFYYQKSKLTEGMKTFLRFFENELKRIY